MNIPLKFKVIIYVVALALTFGIGRYTAPGSETKSQTITQEKEKEKTHTQATTTTIKTPDGTEKTVTVTDVVATSTTVKSENNTTQTVLRAEHKTLNVSLMAGYDIRDVGAAPRYGLTVTKEILDPLTIGIWGISNSTVGLSVGINF